MSDADKKAATEKLAPALKLVSEAVDQLKPLVEEAPAPSAMQAAAAQLKLPRHRAALVTLAQYADVMEQATARSRMLADAARIVLAGNPELKARGALENALAAWDQIHG